MQDRFKFRVWNKIDNRFEIDSEFDEYDTYNIITLQEGFIFHTREDGNENYENEYYQSDNFIIQQCTGLKDKNGKLIFEGDIVNVLPELDTIGIIKWSDDLARFIIVFENIQADFDNYNSSELEVIGNIYENSEKLEANNENT